MDEEYKELATAIVMQGVDDYRKALKKLKDKPQLIIDKINKEVSA